MSDCQKGLVGLAVFSRTLAKLNTKQKILFHHCSINPAPSSCLLISNKLSLKQQNKAADETKLHVQLTREFFFFPARQNTEKSNKGKIHE